MALHYHSLLPSALLDLVVVPCILGLEIFKQSYTTCLVAISTKIMAGEKIIPLQLGVKAIEMGRINNIENYWVTSQHLQSVLQSPFH